MGSEVVVQTTERKPTLLCKKGTVLGPCGSYSWGLYTCGLFRNSFQCSEGMSHWGLV